MTCLTLTALIKLASAQCNANGQYLQMVGFDNINRTTLIVKCNNTQFNLMNFFTKKDKCVKFE